MAKAKWVNRGASLGSFRCATLIGPEQEKTLAGELGEIWQSSEDTFKCFKRLPSGDEKLYTFKSKDLAKWILRLKVPSDPVLQAQFANCR